MSIRSDPKEREKETKILSPTVASKAASVSRIISKVISLLFIVFIITVTAMIVNNSKVMRSVKIEEDLKSHSDTIIIMTAVIALLNIITSEDTIFG